MSIENLVLPTTYEHSRASLNPDSATYYGKLAQFIQPVEKTEAEVANLLSRILPGTGRAVLLLGSTGAGKSTFIQSLTWRKHLGFARLVAIDCSDLDEKTRLLELSSQLQKVCGEARHNKGVTAVSIDYFESLGGISGEEKRAFFQTLNGLLRKSSVLVIWPVTTKHDADLMLLEAKAVSSTIFDGKVPILNFVGPNISSFPLIVKNTISVFNDGKMLQDFLLNDPELDYIRENLISDKESLQTIRVYLERVQDHWSEKSGHLQSLTEKLPRSNEIWCVFCHPKAEEIVSSFATKGNHHPSAWTAYHSKLWEYVPGTQREARWKNPTRLQYAIGGAFVTRIIHMSPQALISAVAAYSAETKLLPIKNEAPSGWASKSSAKKHFKTTALYRQLIGDAPVKGKTKGGPAAVAREAATKPFDALNKIVAGTGNDRYVNHAIAACLKDVLAKDFLISAEVQHPWIPCITPDILIEMPDGRQICIEFCYTNNQKPGAIPDYVLDKISTYMDQLEQFTGIGTV